MQVPVRELVRPPRKGRKVVLLGDTCNSRAILRASAVTLVPLGASEAEIYLPSTLHLNCSPQHHRTAVMRLALGPYEHDCCTCVLLV